MAKKVKRAFHSKEMAYTKTKIQNETKNYHCVLLYPHLGYEYIVNMDYIQYVVKIYTTLILSFPNSINKCDLLFPNSVNKWDWLNPDQQVHCYYSFL